MAAGNDNLTHSSCGKPRCCCAELSTWLLAAVLVVVAVGSAEAQNGAAAGAVAAQPAPQQAPAAAAGSLPAQPPPPAAERGLINGLGQWWKQSFGNFSAKMKAASDRAQDFNKKQDAVAKGALNSAAQATSDAATAIVRLPNTRVLELSDRCAVAANGAPDCLTAATAACRQKGFTTGKPLDIRTSQECPAGVLLTGQTPTASECPEETVVLRAICQ